jgi:hypothetical protein
VTHFDDLPGLWQRENAMGINAQKEKNARWLQLIEEKRRGFDALVRAENQTEYALALGMGPILGLLALRAKFPLARIGFGILAAALIGLGIATWLSHRHSADKNDESLSGHLSGLIESYEKRMRFVRNGRAGISVLLPLGIGAVILGVPGYAAEPGPWIFCSAVVAGFWVVQWLSYRAVRASMARKRDDAVDMLRDLEH